MSDKKKDNQTTDRNLIVPVVGGKVQKECTRDEFLNTLANLSDEERKNSNWSIIK
jgi:hypothetical protein